MKDFYGLERRDVGELELVIAGASATGDITGEGAVGALSAFEYLTGQEMRNLGWALKDEWER